MVSGGTIANFKLVVFSIILFIGSKFLALTFVMALCVRRTVHEPRPPSKIIQASTI